MPPLSNAEKQARFRKKVELATLAHNVFQEWQDVSPDTASDIKPEHVRSLLSRAAALPSGWTDEDYEQAGRRIGQVRNELLASLNELQNDVYETRPLEEYLKPQDSGASVDELQKAVSDARALASHLISGIELSPIENADKAAAVMEALRHVGRTLAASSEVAKSAGNAVCLVSLQRPHGNPDWLMERFLEYLVAHLDEASVRELGERLVACYPKA